jgi:protease IV
MQLPHAALVRNEGAIDTNADAIYANRTSLVGSIGVRVDSFGFTDVIQRFGIERRLYVAGNYMGALDMFSPVRAEEEAHIHDT